METSLPKQAIKDLESQIPNFHEQVTDLVRAAKKLRVKSTI